MNVVKLKHTKNDETREFLDTLFHGSTANNYYTICIENNVGRHKVYNGIEEIANGINKELNSYICTSTLVYSKYSNGKDATNKEYNMNEITCLKADLDCHSEIADFVRDIKIKNTISIIRKAVEEKEMPLPTMIVNSGRGLHLYWVYNNAVKTKINGKNFTKEYYLHKYTQQALLGKLNNILHRYKDYNILDIDMGVKDITRVLRVPGTYNDKAKKYSILLSNTEMYYTLSNIANKYFKDEIEELKPKKVYKPNKKRFKRYIRQIKTSTGNGKGLTPKVTIRENLNKRVDLLKNIQSMRGINCKGYRNTMLVMYCNLLCNLYTTSSVMTELREFNNNFKEPLTEREVNNVIKMFVGEDGQIKKYYYWTNKRIIEVLNITAAEREQLNFTISIKQHKKEISSKKKVTKEERNKQIIELCKQGIKQKEIAEKLNISIGTVNKVIKAYLKPWEQLGISKATYYRKKSKGLL